MFPGAVSSLVSESSSRVGESPQSVLACDNQTIDSSEKDLFQTLL